MLSVSSAKLLYLLYSVNPKAASDITHYIRSSSHIRDPPAYLCTTAKDVLKEMRGCISDCNRVAELGGVTVVGLLRASVSAKLSVPKDQQGEWHARMARIRFKIKVRLKGPSPHLHQGDPGQQEGHSSHK